MIARSRLFGSRRVDAVVTVLAILAPFSCRAILGIEDPEPRQETGAGQAGEASGGRGGANGGGAAGSSGATAGNTAGGASGSSQGGTSGTDGGPGGETTGGSATGGSATGGNGTGGGGGDDGMDDCMPNPCRNGGTCTDVGSTYDCECTAEYLGATCTLRRLEGLGSSTSPTA